MFLVGSLGLWMELMTTDGLILCWFLDSILTVCDNFAASSWFLILWFFYILDCSWCFLICFVWNIYFLQFLKKIIKKCVWKHRHNNQIFPLLRKLTWDCVHQLGNWEDISSKPCKHLVEQFATLCILKDTSCNLGHFFFSVKMSVGRWVGR